MCTSCKNCWGMSQMLFKRACGKRAEFATYYFNVQQLCSAVLSVGHYSERNFITHKLLKHLNHYRAGRMSKPPSHVFPHLCDKLQFFSKRWIKLAIVHIFTPNHTLTGESLCIFSGPKIDELGHWWPWVTSLITDDPWSVCGFKQYLHHSRVPSEVRQVIKQHKTQHEFVSRVTCTKPIMFVFYSVERIRLIEPAALSAPGCCYSHCNEVVGQPVTFACLWMLASRHPCMTPLLPVAGHGSPHSAPSGGSKGPSHVTQWLIRGVTEIRAVKLGSRISSDDKCMFISGHKTQRVIWDFCWQSAQLEATNTSDGIMTV